MINSNNTQRNSDHDFTKLWKRILGNQGGVESKEQFIFDNDTKKLSAGSDIATAYILCTRPASNPIPNQKFLAQFEFTGSLDFLNITNGDKIFIEIKENLVKDPTLIEDLDSQTNYNQGLGIWEIKMAKNYPSHSNYLKLYEWNDGKLIDLRKVISLPAIDEVAQKTSILEEKLSTAEGKIEQIENGWPTNFMVERELGEDIPAGKAYFLWKWWTKTITERQSENQSRKWVWSWRFLWIDTWVGYLRYTWKFPEVWVQLWDNIRYRNEWNSWWAAIRIADKDFNVIASLDWSWSNDITLDLWTVQKNWPIYVAVWNGNVKWYFMYYPAWIYENIGKIIRTVAIPILWYKSVSFTLTKVWNPTEIKRWFDFWNNSTLSVIWEWTHRIDIPKWREYLFLRREVLDSSNYYKITNVVLENFDWWKKFLSTTWDPIREDFVGIEKKWGVKWETTQWIEMWLMETEKENGHYYLGENGQITKTISGCYVWEVKNWMLRIIGNSNKLAWVISNSATTGNVSLGNAQGFIIIHVNWEPKKIPVYWV